MLHSRPCFYFLLGSEVLWVLFDMQEVSSNLSWKQATATWARASPKSFPACVGSSLLRKQPQMNLNYLAKSPKYAAWVSSLPRTESQTAWLASQVSHLELKNKPQILQQTFVKPHQFFLAPFKPLWNHGLWEEWTASSMALEPLSPSMHQITQLQAAPHLFQFWGGILNMHRATKFQLQCNIHYYDTAQVPAPLTSPQRT